MKKAKKWILWGFVILWMGNILAFSSQSAEISDQQSGYFVRVVQKLIVCVEKKFNSKLLAPNQLDYLVRKTAHVFNYLVLTLLLVFAWMASSKQIYLIGMRSWGIAFLFSMLDEFYQTLIPGRSGMFRDVLIDQIGTIIAILLIYLVLKKKWLLKH